MTISAEEAQKKYGITARRLDELEKMATEGILPGEPGEVTVGRPLKFGQRLKLVGYKETPDNIAAMDRRAASQGMSRSDYLRDLVHKDLATA